MPRIRSSFHSVSILSSSEDNSIVAKRRAATSARKESTVVLSFKRLWTDYLGNINIWSICGISTMTSRPATQIFCSLPYGPISILDTGSAAEHVNSRPMWFESLGLQSKDYNVNREVAVATAKSGWLILPFLVLDKCLRWLLWLQSIRCLLICERATASVHRLILSDIDECVITDFLCYWYLAL